jgi:hypothetical protein
MVDGPNPIRNFFVNTTFTGDFKAPNPIFAEKPESDEISALKEDFSFKYEAEKEAVDMPKMHVDTYASMATYTKPDYDHTKDT